MCQSLTNKTHLACHAMPKLGTIYKVPQYMSSTNYVLCYLAWGITLTADVIFIADKIALYNELIIKSPLQ